VLSSDQLKVLLEEFAFRLGETGERLQCVVVGGAALALTVIPDRHATEDVDVFAQLTPKAEEIVAALAKEHNLADPKWLNSKAQAFMSPVAPINEQDLGVIFEHRDVVIRVLDANSLFALKCRAGRISKDGNDLLALADFLEITTIEEAKLVMDGYYAGEEVMKPNAHRILAEHFESALTSDSAEVEQDATRPDSNQVLKQRGSYKPRPTDPGLSL